MCLGMELLCQIVRAVVNILGFLCRRVGPNMSPGMVTMTEENAMKTKRVPLPEEIIVAPLPEELVAAAQADIEATGRELIDLETEESRLSTKQMELSAKKKRIEERQQGARIRLAQVHGELALQHMDLLLALTPKHSYQDCSDAHFVSRYDKCPPCTRCMLLTWLEVRFLMMRTGVFIIRVAKRLFQKR